MGTTPGNLIREADGRPVLAGGRCEDCGYIFFPMQNFGCEKCGSYGPALTEFILEADGTLMSWATVHIHPDKSRPAPFIVGEVKLDAGPVVRALIASDSDTHFRPGLPVCGGFADGLPEESATFRFRFVPTNAGEIA